MDIVAAVLSTAAPVSVSGSCQYILYVCVFCSMVVQGNRQKGSVCSLHSNFFFFCHSSNNYNLKIKYFIEQLHSNDSTGLVIVVLGTYIEGLPTLDKQLASNSCKTLIGMHEMHGQMHLN